MNFSHRGFGWKKDPHDERDRIRAPRPELTRIPERRLDLLVDYVRDQGPSSSCVGHAIVGGLELLYAVVGHPISRRSPKHAYWNARAIDKFQHEDGGAFVRSGLKGAQKVGICSEATLPLDIATINERPSEAAEAEGVTFADFAYERITHGVEGVLDAVQLGHPVVWGVNVTSLFVACSGTETIPAPKRGDVIAGGHAFIICGYEQHNGRWRFRIWNSWSRDWGDRGFAWMDQDWVIDPTAQDVIALVRTGPQPTGAA